MSFLEVKGLTKNFGGLTAVNKLNFEVKEGEIFGLIGPNGAGKSTVFSLITSYLKPSSGDIIFQDQNITNFNTHEIAAIGIVRTFQQNNLFMDMTVQQNVVVAHHLLCTAGKWSQFLNSKQARIDEERFQESAMKILDDLGLVKFKNAKARNLSHGHKRVLGIATGIALKPKLFLLDEAFSGMNPKETETTMEMIKGIRNKGITVVIVEHNMKAVMGICERILVINFGEKIAEGRPEEIKQNEAVIEAYLGREDGK